MYTRFLIIANKLWNSSLQGYVKIASFNRVMQYDMGHLANLNCNILLTVLQHFAADLYFFHKYI